MASDLSFAEYVRDQMNGAGRVTFRKMFGEYAVYCNGKVVALICDNQLYVKPTSGGRELIENIVEASPYPGAKLCFLIDEQLDDHQWMSNLIRVTARELPMPKPKKPMAPEEQKAKKPSKPRKRNSRV